MQSNRSRAVLALCVALLVLTSCGPKPVVESAWPRADRERVVAAPAPATRWPLTGLPAGVEGTAVPPPVLVPIVGASPALADADLVFEWPAGDTTRLQALFQSRVPSSPVGPVADAKAADLPIARAYGAAFAHVGSIDQSQDTSGVVDAGEEQLAESYRAATGGRAVDVASVQSAEASGYAPVAVFGWDDKPASGSDVSRITAVTVPLTPTSAATWTWNAGAGVYVRGVQGARPAKPPVRAANVIVIWVPGGVGNEPARYVGLSGRASLFRGGRKVVARWQGSADSPLRILADDGTSLSLAPGNTWVEVIPNAVDITLR